MLKVEVTAKVAEIAYKDTNGNDSQDAGLPDIEGLDVVFTDSSGRSQTVITGQKWPVRGRCAAWIN